MDKHFSPIEDACRIALGQSNLAKILNVSPAAVNQWVKRSRPVPTRHCVAIEKATGISRKLLRPDDWQEIWPEGQSADKSEPAQQKHPN